MLGKWIIFDDLAGPVFASDTGVPCTSQTPSKSRRKKRRHSVGCVSRDQVDVFVGGPEWHRHAARMGVMEWEGKVME